ncbi:MAG: hypothetical protein HWE18_04770 [Gammaproteobacteria bacterium]|nr:hypothetical protein [Gammaproteobacteria bacterium]
MELVISKTENGVFKIFASNQIIRSEEASYAVEEVTSFNTQSGKIYIVSFTSGGMACAAEFRIYDLRNREIKESEVFGQCSDLQESSFENGILTIKTPVYFNPMHDTDRDNIEYADYEWDGISIKRK